jgi:hypothetical protein
MDTPPSPPQLHIELEATMFDSYENELKSITLETMKEILRQLYKDPLVFNAKEAIIINGLKERGLL